MFPHILTPLRPLAAPVQALVDHAQAWGHAWSVESQQVARRNAMVANTALLTRRRDREDVESWLAAQERVRRADQRPEQRVTR